MSVMASFMVFLVFISILFLPMANSICADQQHQKNLVETVVQLSNWFRINYGSFDTLEPHMASLMLTSLRFAGNQQETLLSDYRVNSSSVLDSLEFHLKNNLTTIPLGKMAYIYLGALALCSRPQQIVGKDVMKFFIDGLGTFRKPGIKDFSNYFQYSLVVLSICNSAETIPKSVANRIASELSKRHQLLSKSSPSSFPDTNALVIMALSCLKEKALVKTKVNGILLKYLDDFMDSFKMKNSWNIYSKPWVVQALASLPSDILQNPKYPHIKKYQMEVTKDILGKKGETDNIFGDVYVNSCVLLALTGRSLVHVGKISCAKAVVDPERKNISVCVQLSYKMNSIAKTSRVDLTVPENTIAMEILKIAAKRNSAFTFTAKKYSFGHSITSISGIKQDWSKGYYWAIYTSENNLPMVMSSNGVDKLKPKHNTCVIFRYKNYKAKKIVPQSKT